MEEVKKRKTRKRSEKTPITRPAQSELARACWQDPEYREKVLATRAETRAAREAAGDPVKGRWGVPDGMRKDIAKRFWKQARFEATLTMKKLEKAGVLNDADDMAKDALHTALSIMKMEIQQKDRLAAARLVLDFTKAKPASKQEITVNKAEEWLEQVVADNGESADEEATGGAEAAPN